MLFRLEFLEGIASGAITVAFRRWMRPTVRAGGTLLTPVGQLAITHVDVIQASAITEQAAAQAGFGSRDALLAELGERKRGDLYRVKFRRLGDDPRIALRENDRLTVPELEELAGRLSQLDARSATGAWTGAVLDAIARHPGVRAGDLAPAAGHELVIFKRKVRKLKALGLTESLGTGYCLSPRGTRLVTFLAAARLPADTVSPAPAAMRSASPSDRAGRSTRNRRRA